VWLRTYRNAGFAVIAQGIASSTGTHHSFIFSFAELLTVPIVDLACIWYDCKGDKFIGRLNIYRQLKTQAACKTSLASISQTPHHFGNNSCQRP